MEINCTNCKYGRGPFFQKAGCPIQGIPFEEYEKHVCTSHHAFWVNENSIEPPENEDYEISRIRSAIRIMEYMWETVHSYVSTGDGCGGMAETPELFDLECAIEKVIEETKEKLKEIEDGNRSVRFGGTSSGGGGDGDNR